MSEIPFDKLHKSKKFRPKYPSEHVVRFMYNNLKEDDKVLDVGCGAGRHSIMFANEGIQVYSCDLSIIGLQYLREDFLKQKLNGFISIANSKCLPFHNNYFDAVLSFGVLYYSNIKEYKESIDEIYRVLKEGGKTFVVTRTTDDYRYGKGIKIDENSYILNIDETNEKGMNMCFLSRKQIDEIFSEFKKVYVNKTETTFSNRKDSDWLITAYK